MWYRNGFESDRLRVPAGRSVWDYSSLLFEEPAVSSR
jgi:hypothetical protein